MIKWVLKWCHRVRPSDAIARVPFLSSAGESALLVQRSACGWTGGDLSCLPGSHCRVCLISSVKCQRAAWFRSLCTGLRRSWRTRTSSSGPRPSTSPPACSKEPLTRCVRRAGGCRTPRAQSSIGGPPRGRGSGEPRLLPDRPRRREQLRARAPPPVCGGLDVGLCAASLLAGLVRSRLPGPSLVFHVVDWVLVISIFKGMSPFFSV